MKKIYSGIQFLAFFLILFGFTGCEKEDMEIGKVTYDRQPFVVFESGSSSVSEDAPDPQDIVVFRGSKNASQPLIVTYTVTSSFGSSGGNADNTFTIADKGQLTIPAGEFKGIIPVMPVNNEATDGDKIVTVTLASASDASFSIGYPGPASASKSHTVTIQDDDCALVLADYTGTFDVTISQSPFWEGVHKHTSQIRLGDAPNTLVVSNFWDISEVGVASYNDIVVVFNPVTRTATVPAQPFYFNSAGASRSVSTNTLAPGRIITCTTSFILNFIVFRTASGPGSLIDTAEGVVFTKQ